MINKIQLLSILFLFITSLSFGQTYDYQFSFFQKDYEPITDGTVINPDKAFDVSETYEVDMGMDFTLLNFTTSTLTITGEVISFKYDDSTIGSEYNIYPLGLAPADIGNIYVDKKTGSPISYTTEEVEGDKVFKLQFETAGFLYGGAEDFISYQVWFYEGSNRIEIHYGPRSIADEAKLFTDDSQPKIGIADEFLLPENAYGLKGNPSNPQFIQYAWQEDTPYLDALPNENTVYRFLHAASANTGVGLEEEMTIEEGLDIQIYPNPVIDEMVIEADAWNVSMQSVQIFNLIGQNVYNDNIDGQAQVRINLADLPKGWYAVNIQTDQGEFVKTIVKADF